MILRSSSASNSSRSVQRPPAPFRWWRGGPARPVSKEITKLISSILLTRLGDEVDSQCSRLALGGFPLASPIFGYNSSYLRAVIEFCRNNILLSHVFQRCVARMND